MALDKLGSFHSSFLYLRDLDIDIVRFDTFYSKSSNQNSSKNMLDGLNLMAHKRGVKTWIKMLETEEMNSFAQEIGINYRQGNIVSEIKKEVVI
ncbi:MAG: EAL domain-containing protein [Sulfurimonas sp.]|nr:EAL domain-containing protein [Sulfurimonas sp.]